MSCPGVPTAPHCVGSAASQRRRRAVEDIGRGPGAFSGRAYGETLGRQLLGDRVVPSARSSFLKCARLYSLKRCVTLASWARIAARCRRSVHSRHRGWWVMSFRWWSLDDAREQQSQPAQRDVGGGDAFFEVVVDRSQVDDLFHVPPAAFDFEQLLVADRDVLGGQVRVGTAQRVTYS